MKIRKARAADARAVGRVHVDSWRTTYAHLLPAEYLAQLSSGERAAQWRRVLPDDATTAGRCPGLAYYRLSGGRAA